MKKQHGRNISYILADPFLAKSASSANLRSYAFSAFSSFRMPHPVIPKSVKMFENKCSYELFFKLLYGGKH